MSLLSQTYSREKVVHAAASCAWVYISKRHMLLSLSNSIICCIPVVNWSNILIELPFGCRCSFYHRLKVHHDYEKDWESKVTQDIIIMNQWPHIDGIKAGPLHLQHSDSVWPGEMVNWEKKVVPHAVENKKNRAQSKTLSKVDGIIANPSGNSWPEFDSPKKSKYMGNRMMERGYFATVFPDEGCLANPRWRMSCKWCQIVKFSCCATFPWPSQNSKTFLLHFDLFHLTSKTFLFLRFDL